jgi:ATP synthase protein I
MSTPDRSGNPAETSSKSPVKDGALKSLVRVESLVQLGLMIPAATFIGWAIGVGLDHWFKQHWIYIPGLLLGAAAGFVQIIRAVVALSKE